MNITNNIYYTSYKQLEKQGISFSDYSKGKSYYTQLAPLFDIMNSREEFTKKEADFLVSITRQCIGYEPRSFLDIACGTGRHLNELTEKGYQAYGIDSSKELLALARTSAPHASVFEADMRSFSIGVSVDCAYSLWDSYVYLSRPEDVAAFAQQCSAHIKRGGILVLDSKNYQKQRPTTEVEHRTNQFGKLLIDTVVRRKLYLQDKVYEAIFTSVIEDTEIGEAHVVVDQTLAKMYSIADLEKSLQPQDLQFVKGYGNFDGSKYDSELSGRMIAVFRKL